MKSQDEEKYFAEVWPTLTAEQKREAYQHAVQFLTQILVEKHSKPPSTG